MANERDQVMKRVMADQARLLRQENDLARDVAQAYEAARRELMANVMDRFAQLGAEPTPAQIRQLAIDVNLYRGIESRLAQLEAQFGAALREGLGSIGQAGFDAALAEVTILATGLGVTFFQFAVDPLLELTIGAALEQVPGLISSLRITLTSDLRTGLAEGERMGEIVRRLYNRDNSIFQRGMTSAELMTRRAVVQANNNARMLFYEEARQQIPGLKKQAVAAIQPRTTRACLAVHGQIRELDEPFEITREPRFAEKQMQPPFHWNCRTTVVAYHERFEERSSLTTADMRAAAQAELGRR